MTPGEERTEPRLVYEDERLLAVWKPPRMHCAPGRGEGELCSWVRERYPETSGEKAAFCRRGAPAGRRDDEGFLLHRLDYETSGLVLFARDAGAYGNLLAEQGAGRFRKEYEAFCSASRESGPLGSRPARGSVPGVDPAAWEAARETGDAEVLRSLLAGETRLLRTGFRPYGPHGARVACLLEPEAGRPAYLTEILGPVDPSGLDGGLIGLRLRLARGFRHQIRAQLAWIGLPISGDLIYGGAPDSRLRLYAAALEFSHPTTGERMRIAVAPS